MSEGKIERRDFGGVCHGMKYRKGKL
jgi:hypothetical protein